jgi:DNA polymerase-3 subunit alpha
MQTYTNVKLAKLQEEIDECQTSKKGRRVMFAGIITDTKDLLTKANRKGKRITLEDDSGVYEIALFGKDYEQFIGFLNLHEAVYVEAEIKEQRYREGQYGLNITSINFLGNLNESRIASLTISINTRLLNPEFRQKLVKLLKKFKGDIPLKVNCFDERTGYHLRMHSKTINVNVCEAFINEVQRLGMTYEAELK